MSEEAEETKENKESREEERAFSKEKEFTQNAEANQNIEAKNKANQEFGARMKAYKEKIELQGQILGGKTALPKFTPEIARGTFNLVNTSEINPATDLYIHNNGKKLVLDGSSFDPTIIDQVLNVKNKKVAQAIADTLTNLPGPSERLQYLAERGTDDFVVNGGYNEYNPISDLGVQTPVTSSAKNVREVMKNARSLIEGKIAKFGGGKEVEIKGAKYKVEGTAIFKDGETFFDFRELKTNIDQLSAAKEKLEKMEREGRSPEDVERARGDVAKEKSSFWKNFFSDFTAGGVTKTGGWIVLLVLVIYGIIIVEDGVKALVQQKKKEIDGCYLISNDTYLQDQNPKCVSCASATFKVSSCSNPDCCAPFQGNIPPFPTGFKMKNQNSYWYVGDGDVVCDGNLTHPSYLSVEKCYQERKKKDKDIDRPQLSAEAAAEFNTRGISVQTSPVPLSYWTANGSVTYGIRTLNSSDALTEVACDLEKALCNVGSGIGNLFLKIALPILIVCGLFYFIKFEYDKYDGKVKAKYRK